MPAFRKPRPQVVIFDVNETLTDMEPLRARLDAAGADPALLELWFASTLRDGIALTAAGGFATFADVATAALARLAPEADAASAADGLSDAQPQPDVAVGLPPLAGAGFRIATLSNGSPNTAARALERAGVSELVEQNLSVEAVGRWKPAREPYAYACTECGVAPAQAMLVSVHPWDVDGASRAGLRTCLVDRDDAGYPALLRQPDIVVASLAELQANLDAT
ncbi:MAG TPA: haloacid dehalogenase type II [Thermoleophilaceae bacterium]|jgi:2-haloacid dehalogenase|nr:haloacid dehalogenase type II [Thermoleophilaceae bacterium]